MVRLISAVMVIIALTAGLVFLGNAQEPAQQAPQGPPKDDPSYQLAMKQEQAGAELDAVAKELAALLTEPSFRGHVRSTMVQSKKLENIVELEAFLADAAKKTDFPPGVKKLNENTLKAKGRIEALNIVNKNGFDLYMPVKDHLKKWSGGKDVYVAYVPYTDDEKTPEVYAYSVETGERVAFDNGNVPPTVPVIVVAPCEHESHEMPKEEVSPVGSEKSAGQAIERKGNEPRKLEKTHNNSALVLRFLTLLDKHEPWISGAPEIFAYLADVNSGFEHSWRVTDYSNYTDFRQLRPGSDWMTGQQYEVNFKPIPGVSQVVGKNVEPSCTNETVFVVIESDISSYSDPLSYTTNISGVTISATWWEGDDWVGSARLYKSVHFPVYNRDYEAGGGPDARAYWRMMP